MANRASIELQQRLRHFLFGRWGSPETERSQKVALQVLQRPREHGWRAYLVGGFLRDLLTSECYRLPRDFDVVVQGCSSSQLDSAFQDLPSGRNRFGGLNLSCSVEAKRKLDFDVWRLEDTWGINNRNLQHTMDAFVRTPFLNIDSIAVSISPDQAKFEVFEHGFFESLEKRCIEVNYLDNPYPVLCAARAMILAVKLDFCLGIKLSSFICDIANRATADDFCAAQRSHYGFAMFSSEQFDLWTGEIRDRLSRPRKDIRLSSPSERRASVAKKQQIFRASVAGIARADGMDRRVLKSDC